MTEAAKIWFHGPCDRVCHRVTKHWHWSSEPTAEQVGPVSYRARRPSIKPEGGAYFHDVMSVGDLKKRLSHLRDDATISLEGHEHGLYAIAGETVVTIIDVYQPQHESFDSRNDRIV